MESSKEINREVDIPNADHAVMMVDNQPMEIGEEMAEKDSSIEARSLVFGKMP